VLSDAARMLIAGAKMRGFLLRALGGVGVRIHCQQMDEFGLSERVINNDIDFVSSPLHIDGIDRFFLDSNFSLVGYPHVYRQGEHRSYVFLPPSVPKAELHADVYFGTLRFNHTVPRPYFDERTEYTIPISQLLLSKLAIVNLDYKDILDIAALLAEHEIGEGENAEIVQSRELLRAWGRGCSGWGLRKTCALNIIRVRAEIKANISLSGMFKAKVCSRLDVLDRLIRHCPKSMCWRARNAVGEEICGIKLPYFDVVAESDVLM
jgi:hypothetical protein